MIALMAVFAFPIALASLLYSVGWRPQGTINHGELVQPARPIQDVRLQTLAGEPLNFSRFQKKWTMLYFDVPTSAGKISVRCVRCIWLKAKMSTAYSGYLLL